MKACLLNSGGIDSRVTAKIAKDLGYELYSFYIEHPHVSKGAKPAAKRTADLYCISHEVFTYPKDWFLKKKDNGYTGNHFPMSGPTSHVLGAQYAAFMEIEYVFTGLKKEGRLINVGDLIMEICKGGTVRQLIPIFSMPLYDLTTAQVVEKAKELGVPLDDTQSCNHYPPCGICHKCKLRKEVGL